MAKTSNKEENLPVTSVTSVASSVPEVKIEKQEPYGMLGICIKKENLEKFKTLFPLVDTTELTTVTVDNYCYVGRVLNTPITLPAFESEKAYVDTFLTRHLGNDPLAPKVKIYFL